MSSVFWNTSREASLAEVKSVSGCSVCFWANAALKTMPQHGSTLRTSTTTTTILKTTGYPNNLMTAAKCVYFILYTRKLMCMCLCPSVVLVSFGFYIQNYLSACQGANGIETLQCAISYTVHFTLI